MPGVLPRLLLPLPSVPPTLPLLLLSQSAAVLLHAPPSESCCRINGDAKLMLLAPESSAEEGRAASEARLPVLLVADGAGDGVLPPVLPLLPTVPARCARRLGWGNGCCGCGCTACWSSSCTAAAWNGLTICSSVAVTGAAGARSCRPAGCSCSTSPEPPARLPPCLLSLGAVPHSLILSCPSGPLHWQARPL